MDQWILIQVNPWVAKTAKTDMAIQGLRTGANEIC